MKKILTVIGARPQFVKAAAISRVFKTNQKFNEIIVHTGQHYDANMSDIFFDELEITAPEYNLEISGSLHGDMTGSMLKNIEPIMIAEDPDFVMVYGDTNSTLAGALAASKLSIPILHIEAGLRSFNRAMPEEINRVLTDHISSLLFCPTKTAVKNLANEGITSGVHFVGDVMYDAALHMRDIATEQSSILESYNLVQGKYHLATVHRAENTDNLELLTQITDFLLEQNRSLPVVLPLHPRTKKLAEIHNLDLSDLVLLEPLGYMDMTRLICGAKSIFTDSGGLQKEAYFHRVPCTTLRNETEWVETVSHGWNRLWKENEWHMPRKDISDYGTGKAAQDIVRVLQST